MRCSNLVIERNIKVNVQAKVSKSLKGFKVGDNISIDRLKGSKLTGTVDGIYKNFFNVKTKYGFRESVSFVDLAIGKYKIINKAR